MYILFEDLVASSFCVGTRQRFPYLASWLGALFRAVWVKSLLYHLLICFPICFPGNHQLHFLNCITWFEASVSFLLETTLPLFFFLLHLTANCNGWGQFSSSTSCTIHPLAVQFDRHLCSKVLTAFQICPALLARIYSDTKMNLSRVLWLHDLSYNINPAAVLLSHFSSPLKLMLTFYYWICSCPQIKT